MQDQTTVLALFLAPFAPLWLAFTIAETRRARALARANRTEITVARNNREMHLRARANRGVKVFSRNFDSPLALARANREGGR